MHGVGNSVYFDRRGKNHRQNFQETEQLIWKISTRFYIQHFVAEPLNNKGFIYAASSELKNGNWKECWENILRLSIWSALSQPALAKGNLENIVRECKFLII